MTFLEIIKNPLTNLPIQYNGSFREMIKERLSAFEYIIKNSNDLSDNWGDHLMSQTIFKNRSKILCEGILNTIDAYYEGDPSKAYAILANCLKKANITGYLDKNYELKQNTNLFRIRLSSRNFPLSKEELFHIPFEMRSRVSTQRYSIPGLPSLYLANSVYVAWEELKRPGYSEIQATRIVNNRHLRLLDLTTDIFARNNHISDNNSYGWALLYKVMVWPLIATCSVKVKHPADPFKPEYIIPQLLLQWVNKTEVHGIKYSSTHIDLNTTAHDGSFYNVVIPVRTFNVDEGLCPQLQSMFKSTQVLPLHLRQFIIPSDRLAHQPTIASNANPDIAGVELIKGYIQPYASTIFGMLEHNLNGISLESFKH